MKTPVVSVAAAVLSVALAGCVAPIPPVEYYPVTSQHKMLVSQNWNSVADDVAQRLSDALGSTGAAGQPLVLYVKSPRPDSSFGNVFSQLLKTRLLEKGFGVSLDRSVGLPLNYDITLVNHQIDIDDAPHTEVMVTTSVVSGNRYLTRISDVYYINDPDSGQYVAKARYPTELVEVVGQ